MMNSGYLMRSNMFYKVDGNDGGVKGRVEGEGRRDE
jgi:hypothetical protein